MKTLVFLGIIFAVALSESTAQTELWRMTDYSTRSRPRATAAADQEGNTYLARGGAVFPDTIKKVAKNGDVLFAKEVDPVTALAPTAQGVYVIFTRDRSHDSIVYYDAFGNRQWVYTLSGLPRFVVWYATDEAGNLLLVVPSPSPTLQKISSFGKLVFQVPIPTTIVPNVEEEAYSSPLIDKQGRIWVVFQARTLKLRGRENFPNEVSDGFVYAFQFDDKTGSLLRQVKVLHERQSSLTTTAKNQAIYYEVQWPLFSIFQVSGDHLIIGGTALVTKSVSTPRGGNFEEHSEWRVMLVDEGDKVTRFTFGGKGVILVYRPGVVTRTDEWQNALSDIGMGDYGTLYFSGSIARKDNEGGTIRADGVIMSYNLRTKKTGWTNILPDSPAGQLRFDHLVGLLVRFGSRTMRVFSTSGEILATVFTFTDRIVRFATAANSEDGFLCLFMRSSVFSVTPDYVAKYSLSKSLASKPSGERRTLSSLLNNSPNPFNPTTNIEFRIEDAGYVRLTVYNALGEEITTITNESLPAGTYKKTWDASGLPSGVYFYRLDVQSGGAKFSDVRKMLFLK